MRSTPEWYSAHVSRSSSCLDTAAVLFGKGEEAISRIGEMDTLIGANEKRTADLFFHLAQAIRQRRLGHKQPLGDLIDAAFFSKIDQNLPIRVIHGTTPCAARAPT